MMDHETFALGDFPLECGAVLSDARIAYATWGRLDEDRTNAVLLGSFITGTHEGYAPFIGPDLAFDPSRHFIVATNLLGNGLSTSPSNAAPGQRGPAFPPVSIRDNVRAQALLLDSLGVDRLAMVAGFSMGAQQALQWAVSCPGRVERVLAWCGTARSTPHTVLVFEAMRAVLASGRDFAAGRYAAPPVETLRAVASVYAPWGLSQAWYRRNGWEQLGFDSREAFVSGFWQSAMAGLEANDFLAQMTTLQSHDIGATPGQADLASALASIHAKTVLMPGSTDLYFPAEEASDNAAGIPGGQCQPVVSDWGHFAGIGIDPLATTQIAQAARALLAEPAPPLPASPRSTGA